MRIGQARQNSAVTQVNPPSVRLNQRPDLVVIPNSQDTPIAQGQGSGVREVGILGRQPTVVENEIGHGALSNS
jgi:hypothetical protein